MKCSLCEDCGVCEAHPDRPWEGEHASACGVSERPARGATRAMTMIRRCRKALKPNSTKGDGAISGPGGHGPARSGASFGGTAGTVQAALPGATQPKLPTYLTVVPATFLKGAPPRGSSL